MNEHRQMIGSGDHNIQFDRFDKRTLHFQHICQAGKSSGAWESDILHGDTPYSLDVCYIIRQQYIKACKVMDDAKTPGEDTVLPDEI